MKKPNKKYIPLERYDFGGWLKKNAGAIGTGIGALGAIALTGGLAAPAVGAGLAGSTAAGATAAGLAGGAGVIGATGAGLAAGTAATGLAAGSTLGAAGLGASIGSGIGRGVQQQAQMDEMNSLQKQGQRNQQNAMINSKNLGVNNTPTFKCGGKSKRKMKYPGGGNVTTMANTPITTGIDPKLAPASYLEGRGDTMKGAMQAEANRMYNSATWKGSKEYYKNLGNTIKNLPMTDLRGQEEFDHYIQNSPEVADAATKYNFAPQYKRGFSFAMPMVSNDSIITQTQYPDRYKQLSNKKYAQGGYSVDDRGFANSELEDQEVYRTPQGGMHKVNGATHAQGGEAMNLPQGTEILGKNKVPGTNKSYKEFGDKLMKDYNKFTKILSEKHTPLAKKTAQMMLDKTNQQFSTLMNTQEAEKQQGNQTGMYSRGGEQLQPIKGMYSDSAYQIPTTPLDYSNLPQSKQLYTSSQPYTPQQGGSFNLGANLGQISSAAGELAPIAYNIGQGLFGKLQNLNTSDFQNPYESQALSQMADRRYDVNPELEANRNAQLNYTRALRQGAPSQSQYLGNIQNSQVARSRSDAEAYSRQQNMDNAYLGEEAQMRANLGQQRAATKLNIQDINDRNKAAKRNFTSTALSQLQQYTQNARMTKGLQNRDKQLMDIYKQTYRGYSFIPQFNS